MNVAYSSLGALLDDLRSLFPAALMGDPGWERLQPLARRLPACAADSRFGFEFHLSDPSPVADLCVIATPGTRLAEFYGQQDREAVSGVIGSDCAAFIADQGRAPKSFLARTGRGIILEYDLARSPPGMHGIPGVFVVNRGVPEPGRMKLHEEPAALVAALRSAAGWKPDAAETHHVERVCASVANSGMELNDAGVLPGRATRVIRLVAQGTDRAKVAGALEQVQWPGEPSLPTSILSDFAGLASPTFGLDFDVTSEGVLPRLGLEFFRNVESRRRDELFRLDRAGWKPIIDRLEERNWSLPAKAGGVREWPRLEFCFGSDGVYQARQTLNHFKVAIGPDGVSSKAYAGMDVRRVT